MAGQACLIALALSRSHQGERRRMAAAAGIRKDLVGARAADAHVHAASSARLDAIALQKHLDEIGIEQTASNAQTS